MSQRSSPSTSSSLSSNISLVTVAVLTSAAATVSSFALGYHLATSSNSSTTTTSGNNLSNYWKRFWNFNGKDYGVTVWIGSVWLFVSRQAQQQNTNNESSSKPIWSFLSDAMFLGLLISSSSRDSRRNHVNDDDKKSDSSTAAVGKKIINKGTRGLASSNNSNQRFTLPVPPTAQAIQLQSIQDGLSIGGTNTTTSTKATQPQHQQRYLELLVHNVSHTDLVLGTEPPKVGPDASFCDERDDSKFCLSRPRFSAFDEYCQRLMEFVDTHYDDLNLVSFPRHERRSSEVGMFQDNYEIHAEPNKNLNKLPIGFSLSHPSQDEEDRKLLDITPKELSDLRFRGRDAKRVCGLEISVRLNAVFFPLLATLLPLWHSQMNEKYGSSAAGGTSSLKKVLILVSGVGSPRNWTHSINGNSTEKCANLMQLFCKKLYPDLIVVQVHSSKLNIFRYDENITFVQKDLMPTIQSYRDAHAKGLPYPDEITTGAETGDIDDLPFDTEWRKSMNVVLSFADGSPARNHAIQAALRPYRPTYYHCWQLKTFWHESKIVESDIEVHTFAEMETLPPLETSTLDKQEHTQLAAKVVEEMKRFRNDVLQILAANHNDIRKFWLRKTHKPVLAVLAVQKHNEVKLYRGTNVEVSMPTGSLCAERNVIGTALADDPSLKRQDLKAIAVLSVPNPTDASATAAGTMSQATSSASLGTIEYNDIMTENSVSSLVHQKRSTALPPLAPTINAVDPPAKPSTSSSLLNIFRGNTTSKATKATSEMKTAESAQQKQPPKPKKSTTATSTADDNDWILQDVSSALPFIPPASDPTTAVAAPNHTTIGTPPMSSEGVPSNSTIPPFLNLGGENAATTMTPTAADSAPSTPARRMQLYANNPKQQKRTIVVHSHKVRVSSNA